MATMKQVTLTRQLKAGLPNYSNITTGISITWDMEEGESFDFVKGWDIVNHELEMQGKDTDQSWLKTKEYKEHYTTSIRTPKAGDTQ